MSDAPGEHYGDGAHVGRAPPSSSMTDNRTASQFELVGAVRPLFSRTNTHHDQTSESECVVFARVRHLARSSHLRATATRCNQLL
jgi:hypothetical protein